MNEPSLQGSGYRDIPIKEDTLEKIIELGPFFLDCSLDQLIEMILSKGITRLMEEYIDKQALDKVPYGVKDCLVVEPGGATYIRKPSSSPFYTLEELQEIVGGYIEHVSLISGHWSMYCDEDGKRKGRMFNQLASSVTGQEIVGTVLFCVNSRVL